MTIEQLVAGFLAWVRRHRDPGTAVYYEGRLKLFRAKFGFRDVGNLTSLEIDEWLFEAGAGCGPTTRRHNAVAVTALQNFAREHDLLAKDWFRKLEKPRALRRERIPTPEELAALLARASIEVLRMIAGLCQSGCRPGELCGLQVPNVHWDEGVCIIPQHKTARRTVKPRRVPIGDAFAATLRDALGEPPRTEGPVFLSPRGKPWTVDGFEAAWRRLRTKAGLPEDLVPYHCRHWFGTQLLKAKVPLKQAAELMGHKRTSTTELYAHLDPGELAREQNQVPTLPFPRPPDPAAGSPPAAA